MNIRLTIDVVRAWVTMRIQQRRTEDPDRGDVPGWVIVVAITVTLALAIGAIIVQKVTAKATSIDLQ